MKMELYREQCVMEGKLLGKFIFYSLTKSFIIDAEEAQSKIEELRD